MNAAQSPDGQVASSTTGTSSGGGKPNKNLQTQVNSLKSKIKDLQSQVQKLIQDVTALKASGGAGGQDTNKQLEGLQKVVSQLSTSISNLKESFDGLKTNLATQISRIEKKLDDLDKKVGSPSSGGSPDLAPVLVSLDEVKTKYLANLLNQTPLFTYEDYLKFFWLKPKVEILKDHSGSIHVGGSMTRFALKNHNSYFIGSQGNGYKLFENGQKVDEGAFSAGANDLVNAVYVKDCDCYFMILSGKLYRKRIDALSPEIWIDNQGFGVGLWWNHHTALYYSEKLKRIVTVKGDKTIAFIDPNKKEIEFQLLFGFADHLMDVKFFGENDEKILFVAQNGYVGIFKYNLNQRKGQIISKIHYPGSGEQRGSAIDIDSRNKVALISTLHCRQSPCKLSTIKAFEIWNDQLTQTASLDVDDGSHWIKGLRFVKNDKNLSIFVGVDTADRGNVHTYRYNSLTKVLTQERQKRVSTQEETPMKLVRLDEWFYYTGQDGKLMRVKMVDGREE